MLRGLSSNLTQRETHRWMIFFCLQTKVGNGQRVKLIQSNSQRPFRHGSTVRILSGIITFKQKTSMKAKHLKTVFISLSTNPLFVVTFCCPHFLLQDLLGWLHPAEVLQEDSSRSRVLAGLCPDVKKAIFFWGGYSTINMSGSKQIDMIVPACSCYFGWYEFNFDLFRVTMHKSTSIVRWFMTAGKSVVVFFAGQANHKNIERFANDIGNSCGFYLGTFWVHHGQENSNSLVCCSCWLRPDLWSQKASSCGILPRTPNRPTNMQQIVYFFSMLLCRFNGSNVFDMCQYTVHGCQTLQDTVPL